jgi:hypothetical protein
MYVCRHNHVKQISQQNVYEQERETNLSPRARHLPQTLASPLGLAPTLAVLLVLTKRLSGRKNASLLARMIAGEHKVALAHTPPRRVNLDLDALRGR